MALKDIGHLFCGLFVTTEKDIFFEMIYSNT